MKAHLGYIAVLLLAIVWVCAAPSLASGFDGELDEVKAAIKAKGARWQAGDNPISRLSPAERKARLGLLEDPLPLGQGLASAQSSVGGEAVSATLPSGLDWRNYNGGNFVTGIRDQKQCGSCWAFGSTAGLESKTLIVNNTPGIDLDLSEQVAISCSGDGSCDGGFLIDNYFVTTGLPVESCYTYTATNGNCNNACSNWQQSAYKIPSYTWVIPYGSERTVDKLKDGLYTYGPLVVTFYVYFDFYHYTSGIYSHVSGSYQGGHAVLLVGYDDANSCFIVKNSWGASWGEGGYFRIAYSELNTVTTFASQALAYGDPIVYPSSELQHYDWNPVISGGDCTCCHVAPGTFLQSNYRKESAGFCYSCHNPTAVAHGSVLREGYQHSVMVNVTSGCAKRFPTYGNITGGEYNNQPFRRLKDGRKVLCATCHNIMRKTDDSGWVWEKTTTSDRLTYTLQRGGWSLYGKFVPRVYRDTTLWGSQGPTYSKTKKSYLVDPSEYTYNEDAGTITFLTAQDPLYYIYVSLDYPYLRATAQDNHLCSDCHTQITHKGNNCLTCHQGHNTDNLAGIKGKVRTTDHSERTVVFLRYTGANSFADGDSTYDGICEVCHTQTKYYRRDGSGFANHSGGFNYNGRDCTSCHNHSTGFAR